MAAAKNAVPRRFLRLILLLAGLSIGLVLVAVYFSFARATVTIYPKEEPASADFTATIDAAAAADAASLNLVPGRIERIQKEGSKDVTQVDQKLVPDYAHVTVTIYNKQGGAQSLLPKTQLLTKDGIKFRTDEAVTIPGGSSVQVGATADQQGKDYDIPPSTFTIIKLSTALQSLVYAESKEAATGGEHPSTAVSGDDIKNAEDALTQELGQQAADELKGKLTGTEQFVPEAVATKVLEKSSTA
ncbi:MAG: baseplate J/gp47 family protein, partial [Candidatus Andersenbacteria bacterium]